MVKAEYFKPLYSEIPGAFSDPRVFLVRRDDPRAHLCSKQECYSFQGCDTPTYVVIGKSASDASLAKIHEDLGIPLDNLREFRASQSSYDG